MIKKTLSTSCLTLCLSIILVSSTPPISSRAIQAPTQTTFKCDTLRFHSSRFFLLNPGLMPGGPVLIGGVNFNNPTGDSQAIRLALQGGTLGPCSSTPPQLLNQQLVAAQLSVQMAGGSPVTSNALWANLGCPGLLGNFRPIPLSNGFTLTPNSMLKDLFTQSAFAIRENRILDVFALDALFSKLSNDTALSGCGSVSIPVDCNRDTPCINILTDEFTGLGSCRGLPRAEQAGCGYAVTRRYELCLRHCERKVLDPFEPHF